MLQVNRTYVLNPGYRLRNDIHRIALFSKADGEGYTSLDWNSFIHPLQAAMLGFFTYNRQLKHNIQLLANYFNRDTSYMEKIISSYINNENPIFTIWKGQKIYFPKNTLIDLENIKNKYYFSKIKTDSFICNELDLESKRFYSGPLLLTFMLTNKCLTHCQYCYADTSTKVKKTLSISRILELIDEAYKLQVQQVNLMGGEVFLHKDWDIILKALVKYDISPEFISTKIPFTNELLSKLKGTGYNNLIQISLDACDSHVLEKSIGVKEKYSNDVLKGLRIIDKSGIKYQISTVITTYNCDRDILANLFLFLSTLENLNNWRIVPISNSMTIDYKKNAQLKPTKFELDAIFSYVEKFIIPDAKFPILLGHELVDSIFYADDGGSSYFRGATCSALNTHMFVLPDGKVTICEQLYWNPRFIIGDVNSTNLMEVWNSPQALFLSQLSRNDIQEESNCKSCTFFDHCFNSHNRCWSNIIKAYGNDYWDFPDPRCRFAPDMKNNLGY